MKDSSRRLSIKYYLVNKFTLKYKYPLFLINKILIRFTVVKYITKLNLKVIYY